MIMGRAELGVSFEDFLDRFAQAVRLTDYLVGIGKAPVFAAIIALVGCHQGFQVSGDAESVGRRTTVSVVQSIFAIIVVDAAVLGGLQHGWGSDRGPSTPPRAGPRGPRRPHPLREHVVHEGSAWRSGAGEIFALAGASGCGKSTLLREIILLLRPDSGSIRLLGRRWSASARRRRWPCAAAAG